MKIDRRIHDVRPSLWSVAPLTALICWSYAVINMLIGTSMFFVYKPQVPISIANVLTYQEWGILFFLMGTATAYGMMGNYWRLTRNTQLFGLAVKAIWALALIARTLQNPPSTILVTMIWIFFAIIQAAVYIYFLPRGFGVRQND